MSLEKTPTVHICLKDAGDPLKIKTKIKISGIDYRWQCFAYFSQSHGVIFWRNFDCEKRREETPRPNKTLR